ncbi:conserved hypothetical protein [Aspergillus terreus NIH2624]|uniref:Mtf2-like C-terminal domain-containing protein n=1 Tax=Aspergillus terreus (strain NIH 2624 / FGSC A1156) TaxID=341663 RepID=Q0CSP8_ASPTN|nr:uncharacterized protein ATEG_03286 [Aspergillus terreus NIH2624]EAU36560.1 conserved hypothetical protein [Aspergillus terreus NIH2624]
MTQGEKQVFSELLEQIGVRPDAPSPPADADTQPDPSPTPHASSLSDADRSEMAQISAIFDSVLKDMKRRRGRAASKTVDAAAAAAAAASADEAAATTGLPPGEDADTDADIGHALQEKQVSTERAIELVVQREAGKIEAALRAAVESGAGDTAIWAVCKQRIFSMLRHLDSAEVSALPISDASADDGESETLTVPPGVPHEPVVVALYPQMLLVAFRLLNLHYPGSPLIAQFRATIKAHGRASAVLGSSTGLYNELIYFAWRGAHDLPGVVALLQEMEVTGVEGDGRTCALLDGIARQRERDLTEHRRRVRAEPGGGAAREPWWDLAPNRRATDGGGSHEAETLLDAGELVADGLGIGDATGDKGLGGDEIGGVAGHVEVRGGVDSSDGEPLGVPGGVDGIVTGEVENVGGEGVKFGEGEGDISGEGHDSEGLRID